MDFSAYNLLFLTEFAAIVNVMEITAFISILINFIRQINGFAVFGKKKSEVLQRNREGGNLMMTGRISIFLHKNALWVLISNLVLPLQGNSKEYPQHMFLWRIEENYSLIIIRYKTHLMLWLKCFSVSKICGSCAEVT